MTPTATVCRMSRTAKRPRGAYSVKASTHIGLEGTSFTMAESPDFTHLGVSSRAFPERRSIFWRISSNLQAMWAVWQSRTGAYPFLISPGWLMMMTWAQKSLAPLGGSALVSPQTFPLLISLMETFFTLKPTLSPGRASGKLSWCISTDLTSVVIPAGRRSPPYRASGYRSPHGPRVLFQYRQSCRRPAGADGGPCRWAVLVAR